MKKITFVLLLGMLSMFLMACGDQKTGSGTADGAEQTNETATTDAANSATEESSEETGDTEERESATEDKNEEDTTTGNSTLVVYFSNTGNTKAIAETIADNLGADIYEIEAEEPYSSADLDYGDNNSRSTLEMNDSSARPAISGSVDNFEQYDTLYVGYPIWWGEAPRILDTFVESYDFTNKTVIPFCTSASSGVGSSANRLEELAGSGNWLDGQRFSGSESSDTIMEWVNGL